jgi:hypothetical protein
METRKLCEGGSMFKKFMRYFSLITFLLVMVGCGGGGGSGTPTATVSGVAATGAPLVGTVYLKDSSNPVKELSTPIATDGSFSFNVSGLQAPFILKAVGTSGGQNYTLYSFATDKGIANINPFSNLTVTHAYGNDNLASLYTTADAAKMLAIQQQISVSVSQIKTLLNSLLQQYGVTSINFMTDAYTANHQGLDLLFDMIIIDFAGGNVSIKNRNNNTVIYTSVSNNILSGQINIGNIPAPPVQIPISVAITPSSETVAVNSTANFSASVSGTSNQNVTWSVIETNGGAISSSGSYTAPSAAGTYHIRATSVADSTKYSTASVIVTASPVNTVLKVWKTDSTVSPSITVSVGPSLGTSNYLEHHSGTIQCSLLTNGSASISSISQTGYIVVAPDNSMIIGIADGNYWILIGTDVVAANSTSVNASVQIYNNVTPIYSGYANLIKQ